MGSVTQHEVSGAYWAYEQDAGFEDSGIRSCEAEAAALADRQRRLTRTIESEIIPRLMLVHGTPWEAQAASRAEGHAPDAGDVEGFVALLLAPSQGSAAAFVEAAREHGTPLEAVFLDLFAPAARRIGELWDADLCDFVEVTMALSRLQNLLRELAPSFETEGVPVSGRRVLLAPAPGEQHTFGLALVEEFFRRDGWEVWVEGPGSADDLAACLGRNWFGVVGLSVSGDRLLDRLAPAIRAIRRASLNRAVGIMVGGRIFMENPALVASVGADATAADARQAVCRAQALLDLAGSRR